MIYIVGVSEQRIWHG